MNHYDAATISPESSDVGILTSEPAVRADSRATARFIWTLVSFLLGLAALWIVLYIAYLRLPYLTNGAVVIYKAKVEQERNGRIFPEQHDKKRVLIFGNSKVMAGFAPDVFDRLASDSGHAIYSYNSGFPAHSEFLDQLKILIDRGQTPDLLLLTNPWQSQKKKSVFDFLPDDQTLMTRFFPFRYLLRDTVSFLMESKRRGGVRHAYQSGAEEVRTMSAARGYYFIAAQSMFPGNRLPDNFALSTDTPREVSRRLGDPASPEYAELEGLLRSHNIRCLYVPIYVRPGEFAPAPDQSPLTGQLQSLHSVCEVKGPDYFTLPNSLFSDQVHTNPDGAKIYTQRLFELISSYL